MAISLVGMRQKSWFLEVEPAELFRKTLLLLFLFFPWALPAKTIVVCPDCGLFSIKKAIKAARDADTVLIKKGIYREGQITVDKSIVIIGENYPVLDGESNTEILTIEADNVTVKGLDIRNVGTSFMKDRAGIKVETQRNCIIEGNRLSNTFFGIYLVRSADCIIRNNRVVGDAQSEFTSGNAIHLWYCKRIVVDHNTTAHHRDGIYLEFVEDCRIINNISRNHIRYGMHFMFSNNNVYINNGFESNGAGVAVMYSKNILMSDNHFKHNWGASSYGLLLKEITDSRIEHNIFLDNTTGIYMEGSSRVKVIHNRFERNGWAVKILGNSQDNIFTGNNFFSNSFELVTNTNYNYNTYRGNYWSSYTGYDLDRDGKGDIPFRPVSLYSYIIESNPPTIVLMRSLFTDLLNLAEKIVPTITPATIADEQPLMKKVPW